MSRILIFAGTTEGRTLSEWLASHGALCTVCVATEYGSLLMSPNKNIEVIQGRMNHEQMATLFANGDYSCVVDATHPFAQIVSNEIKLACNTSSLPYLRLSRNTENSDLNSKIVYFDSVEDAGSWLDSKHGNIFVTTGCKEIQKICERIQDKERLYARVLPSVESIQACNKSGITGKHLIAMQGPFSKEINKILMQEIHAVYMLTKETGAAGGYEEKIVAAEECNCTAVVIRNPEHSSVYNDQKLDFMQVLEKIQNITGLNVVPAEQRTLVLAGIGSGNNLLWTQEVKSAVDNADVVFGASSLLNNINLENKVAIPYYTVAQITECLECHPEYKNPVVIFSGDVGFYSGAQAFYKEESNLPYKIKVLNGISSVVYFASRLRKNWQDWTFLSCHGKDLDYINAIACNKKCLIIVSGSEQVNKIGKDIENALQAHLFGSIDIFIGYQLSHPNEYIGHISASDMQDIKEKGLYILLIENSNACSVVNYGLDDSSFIRTKVPMTKRDVRTLVISRLGLKDDSVVYDVGCGTGSITVEAARICRSGFVYSMDCNSNAVELTRQNCEKFFIKNVSIINGIAPECLDTLARPTHVFIGGSSGNIASIIKAVIAKNNRVKIVMTAVTIETACQIHTALAELPVTNVDISQVCISNAETVGSYHLMKAQNPVLIISCMGNGECA